MAALRGYASLRIQAFVWQKERLSRRRGQNVPRGGPAGASPGTTSKVVHGTSIMRVGAGVRS